MYPPDPWVDADFVTPAALRRRLQGWSPIRVCRTQHTTFGLELPGPGIRGAEGKEKAKGVVVRRGLKKAQSKDAGRCTRIGPE